MRILIALGGNALLPRGEVPDASVQEHHIEAVAPALASVAADHQLVITHGNGPQVGLLALESADDRSLSRPYPLDALVAETQGLIGYWLQRAIGAAGLWGPVVALVTQTLVDPEDPSFTSPSKFVGAGYAEPEARRLAAARGWAIGIDGERWRRVVPSPPPVDVVEMPIVAGLLDGGATVICAGGGGVPVAHTSDGLVGIEAVVDKDHVAALLALRLDVDLLVLLTDVPNVVADYGSPSARPIGDVTADELSSHHFPAGSMGPKVEAACRFARHGNGPAVIGALDDLPRILAGTAGTRVSA